MRDPHQVIIHHIGKVVSRITIRFNQDHIIQLTVIHRDITVNIIVESSRPFSRIVLSDHIRNAFRKLCVHFLFRKLQTMLIIYIDFLPGDRSGQCRQPVLIAETIIGLSLIDQLSGIFQIKSLLLPVALHVRSHTAVLIRPLIMHQSRLLQRTVDNIYRPLHITFLICILNP